MNSGHGSAGQSGNDTAAPDSDVLERDHEPATVNQSEQPVRMAVGLKVLFAVDSRFPAIGGAESQALKLARELRQRGAEVEFVAPRIDKSQKLDDCVDGFSLKRIDYPHVRWIGSIVLMFRFGRFLLAHRNRFDVVHVHITHLLAAAAGYVRKRSGIPVVTKISGYYEFEGGVLDQRRRFMPLNLLVRTGLRHIDHVQTISGQTRRKLMAAGFTDDQIRFVPNGIETDDPPESTTVPGQLRIGYLGRLREVKGIDLLISAFAQTQQRRPGLVLQLVIAGDGIMRERLEEQARSLGVNDDIEWLGAISDTRAFFAGIDFYVQPSYAEGLPNSVMEAMAAARPVIASDIGGNNDLITDRVDGRLFPSGDSDALALRMTEFIDQPDRRLRLARAARYSITTTYGFETVVGKLLDLYDE